VASAEPRPLPDAGSRSWALATAALALLPLLLILPTPLGPGFGLTAIVLALLARNGALPAWLRLLLTLAVLAAVFTVMGTRFGRDTGCAVLAAMLAIKPAEAHSLRDVRSLLGFSLFAPFAAFLLDQGPVIMALGLAAALSALLTLQRLADVESQARPLPLGQRLATTARLVALGLPLALAAFWLFPRLATPLWGVPERAVARPGLSDSMEPGGWSELMSDDTPALRVSFDGPVPAQEELYWRGPVMWNFDGRSWTRARWLEGLPPAPLEPGGPAWSYEIEMEPTDRRQLVALDYPLAAPERARLGYERSLGAEQPLSSTTRWRLRSAPAARLEPELTRTVRSVALDLPDGLNPRTLALGRQWRQEAGTDDVAIINRALAWIRAEFVYTLDVPLPGRHAVDDFLFASRQGYCEHFSSAFAVLMRAAGIPSRIVTGYAGGYRNPFGGYWVVRKLDAHAWVEVWLSGRGWVRVDPTAAVAPERIFDTLEQRGNAAGGQPLEMLRLDTLDSLADWMRRGWNDLVLGFDAQRQQALLRPLGLQQLQPSQLLGLFALLAAMTLAGMVWLLSRGEREHDPLLRAWHRLQRRYARIGLSPQAHEPALAWAQRVARMDPARGQALLPLSQRFSAARYAAGNQGMRQLVRDLRRHRP
jgi:transglutaminase-like putative cysteine protease